MCQSLRGLMFGCLVFSITYVLIGLIQLSVGIVFMIYVPVFRLASNICTGILNILLGCLVTLTICYGQTTVNKHRLYLLVSILVVLINLGNLLILEICEWRAFLPPERIQNIMREHKTDLLLAAYLSSTISTAVALVVGFVACEYIYCLLIAASASRSDRLKTQSKQRGFSCRNRQPSWYEPISFSWVFEASDHFNSCPNTAQLKSKKMCSTSETTENPQQSATYVIARDNCDSISSFSANLISSCSEDTKMLPAKKVSRPGSNSHVVVGRMPVDSKSSSGYSSPDWWSHCHNAKNFSHPGSSFEHHYENTEFCHVSYPHLLQNHSVAYKEFPLRHMHQKREACSLGQLPRHHHEHAHHKVIHMMSSPMKQSTLPSLNHRKRTHNEKDDAKIKSRYSLGKLPRKRFKWSSESFNILPSCSNARTHSAQYQQQHSSIFTSNEQPKQDYGVHNLESKACYGNHKDCSMMQLYPSLHENDDEIVQLLQSNVDVPLTVFDRRTSSEDGAIFDVTAEFETPDGPVSPLNFQEPTNYECYNELPTNSSERKNDFPDMVRNCGSAEEGLCNLPCSVQPSRQGSLTSVTAIDNDSLSLSSELDDNDFETLQDHSTNNKSSPENTTNFNTLTPSDSDLSAPEFEDSLTSKDKFETEALKEEILSPQKADVETEVEMVAKNGSEGSSSTKESSKDSVVPTGTKTNIPVSLNGLPSVNLQVTFVAENSSNKEPVVSSQCLEGNSVSYNVPIQMNSNINSRQSEDIDTVSWHKLLKKNSKRNKSWSPVCNKHQATSDGISLHSLERKKEFCTADDGKIFLKGVNHSDPLLHWKTKGYPSLNPANLIDSESLINLSNLELIARQWHKHSLHK